MEDDGAIRRPGPWTTDPAEAETAPAGEADAAPAEVAAPLATARVSAMLASGVWHAAMRSGVQ